MSDNPLADWLAAARAGSRGDDGEPPSAEAGTQVPGTGPPTASPAPWDEPPDVASQPRPRRRLMMLSALTWVVVAGLALLAVTREVLPAVGPEPDGRAAVVARDRGATSSGGTEGADLAAGAVAATAVRHAVTGSRTDDENEQRYVDMAVPEAVERRGEIRVVTVTAVVLEGSSDAWHTARTARYAVPVGWAGGHPLALGRPWALPAHQPPSEEGMSWQPARADDGAVRRALEDAGYGELDVVEVAARADLTGLLRARVDGRAPGETDGAGHEVWLEAGPPPVVLGLDDGAPAARPSHPDTRTELQ